MLEQVKAAIEKKNMLQPGDKVLVAVSGGPDSVALLDILWRLRQQLAISLRVAHLNHMFRGEESLQDAFFVEDYCRSLKIPVTYASIDIPALLTEGGSAQETARRVRYDFLKRIFRLYGCTKLALGHHQNDQAETVLHNLLRGSGPEGLGAMLPRQGEIIRPLLDVSRQEIEQYCEARRLRWRRDPSNEKTIYRRNKIRKELIPLLQQEYNPQIVPLLAQTALIFQEENDFLNRTAKDAAAQLCQMEESRVLIDLEGFRGLHRAMQRRLLRRVLRQLTGIILDFHHIEDILALSESVQTGKMLTLPGGLVAEKLYAHLLLQKIKTSTNAHAKSQVENVNFSYHLPVPGKVRINEARCLIGADLADCDVDRRKRLEVFLDLEKIELPLTVRNRKPGDRFHPLGAPGEKKLKDFFIDRKVPRAQRQRLPLVVDAAGKILWVVGQEINHCCRVTPQTVRCIKLQAVFVQPE